MAVRINLGCGRKYLEGYLNCDVNSTVKADRYFNLEEFPYPLDSGIADEILLDNVLEHLEDVPTVMAELHRILKSGGRVRIIVPYTKSD
jgi:predicted SAM-dependent methyltransferase